MTITTQYTLSLAVSRAMAEAERRRMEMSRSLRPDRVAELLNSQAGAAGASPLPYDQLLALALRAAARPGELKCPTLDALRAPPDPWRRHEIARQVFATDGQERFKAAVKAAPDWEMDRATRRVGRHARDQAAWLRSAAELARSLWDHPALPTTPAYRAAILACATVLTRRADELAPQVAQHDQGWPEAREAAHEARA